MACPRYLLRGHRWGQTQGADGGQMGTFSWFRSPDPRLRNVPSVTIPVVTIPVHDFPSRFPPDFPRSHMSDFHRFPGATDGLEMRAGTVCMIIL